MAKIKDLFIDTDNEMLDADFQYSQYLQKQFSPCCGFNMDQDVTIDGPSYSDIGICPNCKENC